MRYHANPPPKHTLKTFAAWDLAIGEKQVNDWTVGVIGGLDHLDQLYVLDVLRFRGDADKIAEAIVTSAMRWNAELVGIERGQLEMAIGPTLRKMMRLKRSKFALAEGENALVPITDKMSRARPLQGLMQQGRVFFDSSQPWCEELIEEMLRFPVGVFDDRVDALAWLARMALRLDPPKLKRNTSNTVQGKLARILSGVDRMNSYLDA